MREDRDKLFEELYKYYPKVLTFLLNLGYKREDAADLAQEVFTRVYKGMDDYRGESKVTFLEQITRRVAFNDHRDRHAKKREGTPIPLDDVVEIVETTTDAADIALERKENVERVQKAIAQLPPNDQTAIRLQLSGLSCDSIAETLGISVPALKSRLNVARRRLKDILGGDLEGMGGGDDS